MLQGTLELLVLKRLRRGPMHPPAAWPRPPSPLFYRRTSKARPVPNMIANLNESKVRMHKWLYRMALRAGSGLDFQWARTSRVFQSV